MSNPVNVVAEAELPDGTLAIVEDVLNKDVFHVYKKESNVQPNHDAKGIMRYLMHVLHALGYKVDKVQDELRTEQQKTKKMEAKVKLLEQLVKSAGTDGPDVNIVLRSNDWEIIYTDRGTTVYRHADDEQYKWRPAKNVDEILNVIYEKEVK